MERPKPLRTLARELAAGTVTARQVIEDSLARITDTGGEGGRAFISVAAAEARASADAVDGLRAAGVPVPPFAGVPVGVKDLADIAGQVTTAGSTVLADRPPAATDAPAVARLRAAGFIPVGRTNMTEFAYSGLGLNPHHGTPAAPWDRATGRVPGGSSSGTAVAVADGMVPVGLGTDTGGSCRIPAAYCGIVGFKPTADRVPLSGIVPLSDSLDSAGPLASTVDCCTVADAVLAGEPVPESVEGPEPSRLRLAVPTHYFLNGLDAPVADAFNAALAALSAAGVTVEEIPFPELDGIPDLYVNGGLAAAEAYAWHRPLLAERGDGYDQRVRVRIEGGAAITAADYLDIRRGREALIAVAADRIEGYDALVHPTTPILPPVIASFDDGDPAHYGERNLLSLRNTMVGNMLDTCGLSIPATPRGEAPVGFGLLGRPGGDRRLLSVGRTVESILDRAG